MKTYRWSGVALLCDMSEQWVPAEVAKGLYDIVDGERIRYEQFPPESELEMMHMAAILDALAAADGNGGGDG